MDEVAEIKTRLDITEVVSTYLPLKQSGRNLKAPCPFHQEKSASFMVSPEKGIYHCFGCNAGGDIFSFVEKMEGLEFRGALELLARRAGVELSGKRGDGRAAKERERLLEAHELATTYFQMALVKNRPAAEYAIKTRGLKKETLRAWRIGYAPDTWDGLVPILIRKGFGIDELVKAGLAGRRAGRSNGYDYFRGRLMFPICDREGRTIGFTGRVLGDGTPKYLNTPQSPLYDKGNAIFGLHLAKEAIRTSDEVVLVEGNLDVVTSHEAGVAQVVAASGTALTLDQLRTLSKFTRNIKLAFDADRAGLAATERAIELGQQLGLVIKIVTLPEGAKDADELIRRDKDAWARAITAAQYAVDHLFERAEKEYDLSSVIGKRQYADRVAASIRRLGDPVERNHYVQRLAARLEVSTEAIEEKLRDREPKTAGAKPARSARPQAKTSPSHTSAPRRQPASATPAPSEPPLSAFDDAPPPVSEFDTDDGFGPAAPARRPVQRRRPAMQHRGSREALEESMLAVALFYPEVRVALRDLGDASFSTPERVQLFHALLGDPHTPGSDIAKELTKLTDYANILVLRGEQEWSDFAPAGRSLEAFELARRLQITSNRDRKTEISQRLRDAEKDGDAGRVRALLEEYQAIIREEV